MQIIKLQTYISKRGKNKVCLEIVEKIHEARNKGYDYGRDDMKELAECFLEGVGYSGEGAVPVVKIAQKSGFQVIWGSMKNTEMSGFVSINKSNKEKYESDKIIGINGDDELGHQRFVLIHELAHYLFDYEPWKDKPYFDTYIKNSHKSLKEQIANTFAANLLMPARYFALQFDENRSMDGNIRDWTNYFEVQEKAVKKRVLEVMENGI